MFCKDCKKRYPGCSGSCAEFKADHQLREQRKKWLKGQNASVQGYGDWYRQGSFFSRKGGVQR